MTAAPSDRDDRLREERDWCRKADKFLEGCADQILVRASVTDVRRLARFLKRIHDAAQTPPDGGEETPCP